MQAYTQERTMRFELDGRPVHPDASTQEITKARGDTRDLAQLALPPAWAAVAEDVLVTLFPHGLMVSLVEVRDLEGFRAAWQTTLDNAYACENPLLAATASTLLDAAGRLRPGELVEGMMVVGGRTFELWVDATRGVLLSALGRPDLDRAEA